MNPTADRQWQTLLGLYVPTQTVQRATISSRISTMRYLAFFSSFRRCLSVIGLGAGCSTGSMPLRLPMVIAIDPAK